MPRTRRRARTSPALRWSRAGVLAGAAWIGALAAVAALPRVVVRGPSMEPTLTAGDRLAVLPWGVRAGRLVVLADPRDPSRVLVKRVAAVGGDGALDVRGDNAPSSTDSRDFGPVPRSLVRGRPVHRYAPAERAGPVWRA